MTITPLVLIILDGFGYCENSLYNAIANANTPQLDFWWKHHPHTLLEASGQSVGLPELQMGNSEVGHMHIGAGRRVPQDLTRINEAIEEGDFNKNPVLIKTITDMKKNNHALHIMGLLSEGGVHSHEQHLFSFLALCHQQQFFNVVIHLFLDGRDTSPQAARKSLTALNQCLNRHPVGYIASMTGRFYALDRDKRWDRIEPVYRLLTEGLEDVHDQSAEEALNTYYENGIYDEFIPPTQLKPNATIKTGDAIFFFNFRADRARELSEAFLNDSFHGFHRQQRPHLHSFCTMTDYSDTLKTEVLFKPLVLKNTLGELLSNAGLTQLRIAETEKYAHVTFFFNGGAEQTYPGETRMLIPSPHVKTYDLKPEMSAPELTSVLVKAIQDNTYDVIICNYANADMVGHTGNMEATIQAIECLDTCLKSVGDAIQLKHGHLLITADHGNAECMFNEKTNQPQTAHTNEPVPFFYIGPTMKQLQKNHGTLSDVAPTILDLLGLKKPPEMTGHSLLIKDTLDKA